MLKKLILKKKTFQAFLMHHHRAELFVLFNWKKEEGVVSTMLRCSCALTQNLNYQKLLTNLASWEKNSSKQAVAITAAKKGSFLDHKRRERVKQGGVTDRQAQEELLNTQMCLNTCSSAFVRVSMLFYYSNSCKY